MHVTTLKAHRAPRILSLAVGVAVGDDVVVPYVSTLAGPILKRYICMIDISTASSVTAVSIIPK